MLADDQTDVQPPIHKHGASKWLENSLLARQAGSDTAMKNA